VVVVVGGLYQLLDSWAGVVDVGCFDWSVVIHKFDVCEGFARWVVGAEVLKGLVFIVVFSVEGEGDVLR